jgi:hypothetical protein
VVLAREEEGGGGVMCQIMGRGGWEEGDKSDLWVLGCQGERGKRGGLGWCGVVATRLVRFLGRPSGCLCFCFGSFSFSVL